MPANFICQSADHSADGIMRIHLTLDLGQPNHSYFNVTRDLLAMIFNADVREGDTWALQARLVSRAGTNGKRRG